MDGPRPSRILMMVACVFARLFPFPLSFRTGHCFAERLDLPSHQTLHVFHLPLHALRAFRALSVAGPPSSSDMSPRPACPDEVAHLRQTSLTIPRQYQVSPCAIFHYIDHPPHPKRRGSTFTASAPSATRPTPQKPPTNPQTGRVRFRVAPAFCAQPRRATHIAPACARGALLC